MDRRLRGSRPDLEAAEKRKISVDVGNRTATPGFSKPTVKKNVVQTLT
jgi:hypothetical protein